MRCFLLHNWFHKNNTDLSACVSYFLVLPSQFLPKHTQALLSDNCFSGDSRFPLNHLFSPGTAGTHDLHPPRCKDTLLLFILRFFCVFREFQCMNLIFYCLLFDICCQTGFFPSASVRGLNSFIKHSG